jgi:hypothetical protein
MSSDIADRNLVAGRRDGLSLLGVTGHIAGNRIHQQ